MEHIGEILRTAREDNFYTQKKDNGTDRYQPQDSVRL